MATWVGYPKHWTPGRRRPVQYVVIHSTQGSEGPTSAEAGHAYNLRRVESVSTHLFIDSNSAIREVPDADRAHHARFHGNEVGIGIELCGLAQQTPAQWHDVNSLPMLRLAAREVAAICLAHDIPARRLSVAEVRAAYYAPAGQRPKGICGHVDVTAAYPEDDGSHWDPGPNFPWAEFLSWVADEINGGSDVALTQQDLDAIWAYDVNPGSGSYTAKGALFDANNRTGALHNTQIPAMQVDVDTLVAQLDTVEMKLDAILAALTAGGGGGGLAAHTHDQANTTGGVTP